MSDTFGQIVAFMVSSAMECMNDQSPYGSLRLLESVQKLINFAQSYGISNNDTLKKIEERIEKEKGTALTDRKNFQKMIEEVALTLISSDIC